MQRLVDQIICILNDNVLEPRDIKVIYDGDPIMIPEVDMPCLIVSAPSSFTDYLNTRDDETTTSIEISLVMNMKQYVGEGAAQHTAEKCAREIMIERVKSNNAYMEDTVVGAIRKHLSGNTEYAPLLSNFTLNFGTGSERENPTYEAQLSFSALEKCAERNIPTA